MGRFYGKVGYIKTESDGADVYKMVPCERTYYGDVTRNTRRWEKGEYLNDNLNLNNIISILADDYAYEHFFEIRYVEWMGACWKVTDIEVKRPRLILTIGGVYNGPTPEPEGDTEELLGEAQE